MAKPDAQVLSTANPEALRVPPHSIEAEQSVLGALMLDNLSWERVADVLDGPDFYRSDHQFIFQAIAKLAENGSPYDVVTLSEVLENSDQLERVGGLTYLGSLAKNTPSAANIVAYAEIVRERSVLRQLIQVGQGISQSAYRPEGRSTLELLDDAERHVFGIAQQGNIGKEGFRGMKELLQKAVDRIDVLAQTGSSITGVATGFSDLDELTAGLQPGDLIIVAGRPSMGKTAFAINIAEHVAIKADKAVAVFSMEMPGEQLIMRMLSSLGRINQQRLRTGKLEDTDWPRLTSAIGILQDVKLFIDDSAALTPIDIRARARRLMRDNNGELGLIVVDYLQLMQSPRSSENRTAEISDISRSLKALAKELHVPVIALSQLNRSLEQRPNKRPVMSDLRESGAIEQDADVIAFIYRDEVYNEDSPERGIAEIIIAKQRNGPIGMKKLTFLGEYTRFENYIPDSFSMPPEGHQ
ncbi:MAG: replicative DNA helicase [Gammaproteobacteria bacterium]|nr:replicative DNA helicase [Gammaproteobacteria bacterium]